MKQREYLVQHNIIDEINIQLDRNLKQILKLVIKRKQLFAIKRSELETRFKEQINALNRGDKQITMELREADRELNNLLTNVEQNPRLRSTLNSMWNQSIANISKTQNSRTVQFWNTNKKLESQIDVSLKKLKALDINIDGIVGELFNIGKSIDQTDQNIRQILSRRYQNHIQRAEPYSIQKQKLQDSLQAKYQQREKVKEDKVEVIKKLISLLQNLKAHRQARMRSLFQVDDIDMPVYAQFVQGLQKIMKTRQTLNSHEYKDQNRLDEEILKIQQKSQQFINEYLKKQGEGNSILQQLNRSYINKLRAVSLQKALIGDIIPESASRNLGQAVKKCRQFRKILQLSSNQKSMVRQGLQKTKSTTAIFQQILRSIESQRSRRKKLMQQLGRLQQYYNSIRNKQEKKIHIISQLEQIALKKKQLQKRLNDLASRADLDGYKKVTEGMQHLKDEQQQFQNQINKINDHLMNGTSDLQQFTTGLNTQYNDILKQIVPQSWMKKHDLRKPQNILQLNWYLQKTFERLSL